MLDYQPEDDDRFHTHLLTLLSVSAGMVGVCLTAIGLVGIVRSLSQFETVVDDLLAAGTLLFMIVTVLSFLGIRTNIRRKWRGYAITLDVLFCLALAVLVLASMLLAWAVMESPAAAPVGPPLSSTSRMISALYVR